MRAWDKWKFKVDGHYQENPYIVVNIYIFADNSNENVSIMWWMLAGELHVACYVLVC